MQRQRPDHAGLFLIASTQHGYFTADDAAECGISSTLLQHHLRTGRYRRVAWGLYRFRDFPASAEDDLCAAWLAAGRDHAVVSHTSALALLDLSDVIPDGYHLTVPRARRNVRALPGAILHTTTRPLTPLDLTERLGMPVTAPGRTILDAATYGVGPDQIALAIEQATRRAQLDLAALNAAAAEYSRPVAKLIRGISDMIGTQQVWTNAIRRAEAQVREVSLGVATASLDVSRVADVFAETILKASRYVADSAGREIEIEQIESQQDRELGTDDTGGEENNALVVMADPTEEG